MEPMLSEAQRAHLWEALITAETRSHYFADLCGRYQRLQRVITWISLVTSSGAAAAVLGDLPPNLTWLRGVLVLGVVALSLWAVVCNYNRQSSDCSGLHIKWNRLAIECEDLWVEMYSRKAPARLAAIRQQMPEVSQAGASFPNRKGLMTKWQRHVLNQRVKPA